MPPPNEQSAGRGRGRPPIARDRLVRAALALVDERGADALTLRSLAGALNSSTATLYRHFESRDALAREVVDAVFAEIAADTDDFTAQPWDEYLTHLAERIFAGLVRHERVAGLMLEQLPTGPHALAVRERGISALLAHGFARQEAVLTYATLARFVLGFGIQLRSEHDGPPAVRPDSVGSVPLAEEFAFGLHLMIAGLRAHRASAG